MLPKFASKLQDCDFFVQEKVLFTVKIRYDDPTLIFGSLVLRAPLCVLSHTLKLFSIRFRGERKLSPIIFARDLESSAIAEPLWRRT